jgi:hypothetical protein
MVLFTFAAATVFNRAGIASKSSAIVMVVSSFFHNGSITVFNYWLAR